jgi:pheromone shutdown-related protein TraB
MTLAGSQPAGRTEGGPRRRITVGEREFVLLGTAHVSRASAEEVRAEIETGAYDAIAIELCDARYQALTRADEMAQMDLFAVIRRGQAGMVVANLALSAYQQRLADQFGIEPGAEMRAAIAAAENADTPLTLIDRNIGTTLKRVYRGTSWWQRATVVIGLAASLVSSEKISEEDIERLKEGDMLESTFNEFAAQSEHLHAALIDERDQYMAAKLLSQTNTPGRTLVVAGAGHLKGMARYLEQGMDAPEQRMTELDTVQPGARWVKWLPWVVLAVILVGFVLGFTHSESLGWQMVIVWTLVHGSLSALGTLAALGHPLSILTAFFASPLTSLNPTIGAGMVVAVVELWVRKPRVGDFSTLKRDVTTVRGWWRNRISRTLLVFLGATVGSAAGTYISGFWIFRQLLGS